MTIIYAIIPLNLDSKDVAVMDNTNSLAQDKVLILYILNKLNKDITSNDLFKIMSNVNNINYFYFRQILMDLVDSKLIISYTKDNTSVFEISIEGNNSLELTLDVLPGLTKLKADTFLKNEYNHIKDEASVISEYIPEDENNFTVKCKIVENNATIFEIKTFAGSRESAKVISDNWKNNANIIYPKIMNLLTENK